VLLPCLLHVLLPRHRRLLGAGFHLSQLSRFRGPPHIRTARISYNKNLCLIIKNISIVVTWKNFGFRL
jgi:hypothetical protein